MEGMYGWLYVIYVLYNVRMYTLCETRKNLSNDCIPIYLKAHFVISKTRQKLYFKQKLSKI